MRLPCLASLCLASLFLAACSSNGRKGGPAEDMSIPSDGFVMGSSDLANGGCATATYQAHQAPAAMLVILDRSASMADNNKWVFAAQATVQALDQDVFDTMSLVLMTVPSGPINSPPCISFAQPQVACGVAPFPQVDLKPAGTAKSTDPMGVRHDIKQYITTTMPEVDDPDSTPMYGGLQAALSDLQGIKNMKRIIMVVTDGSWDCTTFSNRPGYDDCNMCPHEWEDPGNVVKLLQAANMDPNSPVDTFIVGVPGADTYDASACMYPPYHMRAALSAIAYAGSPGNVPGNCTGKTFTQQTPDPAVSCHFDMTQGNFNTTALVNAITNVRGKVLGCTFDLPPVDGGMVDPNDINVTYSVNGGMDMQLYKRKDPNNTCLTAGCWDWTDANMDKIQLIGKACSDVQTGMNAKVQIVLGCPTIIG